MGVSWVVAALLKEKKNFSSSFSLWMVKVATSCILGSFDVLSHDRLPWWYLSFFLILFVGLAYSVARCNILVTETVRPG